MRLGRDLHGEELRSLVERARVAVPLHADALDEMTTADEVAVPECLGSVRAFRVLAQTRQRPVELRLAEVGDEIVALGSPERLDDLAERLGLHLAEPAEVADYLRFWCATALHLVDQLVESRADFDWVPGATSDPETHARCDRAAHLARPIVAGHPAQGVFLAEGTVLEQRTLHLRRWRVTKAGRVTEVERVLLMEHVPVPYLLP
jgi:hypothetical protein